jgi:N-[(2S)-2-amino-2-carboxyethyl]-L-glutamate dehydrogenase
VFDDVKVVSSGMQSTTIHQPSKGEGQRPPADYTSVCGPLWFNDEDVRRIYEHERVGGAVCDALVCHAQGRTIQPLKPYLRPKGRAAEHTGGRFIAMPAYLGDPFNVAGVKWIAGFPANVGSCLPRATGILVLSSAETGVPLAIMECSYLSAARTAAVCRLAIEVFAPPGPLCLAMLGAGPVGTAVIDHLTRWQRATGARLRIFDPVTERAIQLARQWPGCVEVATSERECVSQCEVVVTATTAAREYLTQDMLLHARLIIPLSLDDCVPEVLLSADKIVVDDFDQCNREEKLFARLVADGRLSRADVYATLGEILAGTKVGRERPEERIYVNLMGMAVEDVAAGVAILALGKASGAGSALVTGLRG